MSGIRPLTRNNKECKKGREKEKALTPHANSFHFCDHLAFPLSFLNTTFFLLGLSSFIFQPIGTSIPFGPLLSLCFVYLKLFGHHLLEAPGLR